MDLTLVSLESLLLRVERRLLDIDLLQILYVFLHSKSLLPHIITIQIIKRYFLSQLILVQSI